MRGSLKSARERIIYFYYLKSEKSKTPSQYIEEENNPLWEPEIGGVEDFAASQAWNWDPGGQDVPLQEGSGHLAASHV